MAEQIGRLSGCDEKQLPGGHIMGYGAAKCITDSDLPEEAMRRAREEIKGLSHDWDTEGYKRALRAVLRDIEAMRVPDPDNSGYWLKLCPEEMIAKIKARLGEV